MEHAPPEHPRTGVSLLGQSSVQLPGDQFGARADLRDRIADLVGRHAEFPSPPVDFVVFMDVDMSAILRPPVPQIISHKAPPT